MIGDAIRISGVYLVTVDRTGRSHDGVEHLFPTRDDATDGYQPAGRELVRVRR
jgi:hypothetical protein